MLEPRDDHFRLLADPPPSVAPDQYAVAALLLLVALDGGRSPVLLIALDADYDELKPR